MSDVDVGNANDPRNGRRKISSVEDVLGLEEEDAEKHRGPKEVSCENEREEDDREVALDILSAVPAEALREMIGEYYESKVTQWSGDLPDPDSFSKYPDYVQRAMVEWGNARIVDESKRLDKISDAVIKSMPRESYLTFAINVIFSLLAFASFIWTKDAASFGFLSVPGVSIAVNLWKSRKKKEVE